MLNDVVTEEFDLAVEHQVGRKTGQIARETRNKMPSISMDGILFISEMMTGNQPSRFAINASALSIRATLRDWPIA